MSRKSKCDLSLLILLEQKYKFVDFLYSVMQKSNEYPDYQSVAKTWPFHLTLTAVAVNSIRPAASELSVFIQYLAVQWLASSILTHWHSNKIIVIYLLFIYLVEPLLRPGPNDNTETTSTVAFLHESCTTAFCNSRRVWAELEKTLHGPQEVFERVQIR